MREARSDFRTFRIERIGKLTVTEDIFKDEKGKTIEDFVARPTEQGYSQPAAVPRGK